MPSYNDRWHLGVYQVIGGSVWLVFSSSCLETNGVTSNGVVWGHGSGIPIYLSPGDYYVSGHWVSFHLLHFEKVEKDETAAEQSENYVEVNVWIRHDVVPTRDVSVDYTTVDGTATAG